MSSLVKQVNSALASTEDIMINIPSVNKSIE